MSEFEDLQRLIRLKRHERPPVEFVEQFVSAFHERQRSEILRGSARGLLWERVTTYFDGLVNPKWAWAGATAVAVFGLGFMLRPTTGNSAMQMAQTQPAKSAPISIDAREVQAAAYQLNRAPAPLSLDVGQNFISRHYGGGLGDEQLYSGTPAPLFPTGFRFDLMPSSDTRR